MAAPRTTIPELPEQTVATDTDELVVQSGPVTKRMTVGRLTTHNTQTIADHIGSISGAHAASAISAVPAGPPFTGADVQTQLSQGADSINQLLALINGHIAVAIDAHNASAISVIPIGNLSAVDVQAALVELQVAIDDLPAGGGGGSGITAEDAVDAIAVALQAGNNIDITYNDTANTIMIDVEPLTKDDVGLSNVNNTADFNKPVSIAQQTALDAKLTTPVWTNYTPVLSVWTLGNGTATGRYMRFGNLVMFSARIQFGSTSVFTAGQPYISAPFPPTTGQITGENNRSLINASFADATGGQSPGSAVMTGGLCMPLVNVVSGSYTSGGTIAATVPFVWTVNDAIFISGFYEPA